jgi:hypothetical protein
MISNLWLNLLRLCNTLVGRRARDGAPSLLILMKCCIAMHLTLRVDHHRRQLKWFAHYLRGEPAADWTTTARRISRVSECSRMEVEEPGGTVAGRARGTSAPK